MLHSCMQHITIFIYILSFSAGCAALTRMVHLYRENPVQCIRAYLYYLVSMNCLTLFNLIVNYIDYNVRSTLSGTGFNTIIAIASIPGYIGLIVTTFAFLFFIMSLLERRLSLLLKNSYSIFCIALLTGYVIGLGTYVSVGSIHFLKIYHGSMNLVFILVTFSVLGFLLVRSRNIADTNRRRAVQEVGLFYSAVYTAPFVVLIVPESMALPILASTLLILNLVSFLFSKRFLHAYLGSSNWKEQQKDMSLFYAQYEISLREQEIIGLILEGKSNKEIEDALFISSHTVKNHIYHIFQKTGVKSRSQLIHLMHQLIETK